MLRFQLFADIRSGSGKCKAVKTQQEYLDKINRKFNLDGTGREGKGAGMSVDSCESEKSAEFDSREVPRSLGQRGYLRQDAWQVGAQATHRALTLHCRPQEQLRERLPVHAVRRGSNVRPLQLQ